MPGATIGAAAAGVSPGTMSERAGVVQAAAKKWGIPAWVLWGVYGTETSYGTNVKTSSTGAQGNFQFEPGTAAQYGYPLTNNTDLKTVGAQADAAAHYLSDLFHQTGSWSTAISAYNAGPRGAYQAGYVQNVQGNGAGINAVKISSSTWAAIAAALGVALPVGAAAIGPEAIISALAGGGAADAGATTGDSAAAGAGAGAGSALSNIAKSLTLGSFLAMLTNPASWLRVLEVVGGLVVLILGLRQLAGVAGAVS